MPPMMGALGRRFFSWKWTSVFFRRLNVRANSAPQIWPMTVARAAPATSIRGKPNRPKMRMGSRMMLMMAPVAWVIMV